MFLGVDQAQFDPTREARRSVNHPPPAPSFGHHRAFGDASASMI
jgi:hypothetical protein